MSIDMRSKSQTAIATSTNPEVAKLKQEIEVNQRTYICIEVLI